MIRKWGDLAVLGQTCDGDLDVAVAWSCGELSILWVDALADGICCWLGCAGLGTRVRKHKNEVLCGFPSGGSSPQVRYSLPMWLMAFALAAPLRLRLLSHTLSLESRIPVLNPRGTI